MTESTVPASLAGVASRAGQSPAALNQPVKIAVEQPQLLLR